MFHLHAHTFVGWVGVGYVNLPQSHTYMIRSHIVYATATVDTCVVAFAHIEKESGKDSYWKHA